MFVKLALLACSLAVAAAVYNGPLAGGRPADLYPAGVSPQACPNFPHCSNPAVAANPQQASPQSWNQPAWQGQNQWNPPAQNNWDNGQWNNNNNNNNNWNSAPVPQYGNGVQERLNRGDYVGDGDYHGEGLAEALAPGYEGRTNWDNGNNNNWNNGNNWNGGNQWNAAPAQTHGVGQIPAGVDAHACPNYPFCS